MNARIALLAPFALAVLAGAGCQPEAPEAPVLRPVRFEEVHAVRGERVRYLTGAAKAGVQSRLSFKTPGTVQQIDVAVGDAVAPGDPIARLDDADYRLLVQEAEAGLSRAMADARNAAANYARVQRLYESDSASRRDLDGARAAAEASAALVRSIQKQLELARNQRAYTRLAAPRAGHIAHVLVDLNENVAAGQPIAVLTGGGAPEVSVSVPESLITQIVEGAPVEAVFDAVPNARFDARVTEVGVAAGRFGATFPVTVRLDEDDPRIRPGMAAEVRFVLPAPDDRPRYFLPPTAVLEEGGERFVYLLERAGEDVGVARRRVVQTGEITAEGLEVFLGLEDGDRVITGGVGQLTDGLEVRMPGPGGLAAQ